ncbi:hypothetical protein GCM10020227_65090 [Streptomyces flavovirens]
MFLQRVPHGPGHENERAVGEGEPRPQDEQGCVLDVLERLVEHGAPGGRRSAADAKEFETGLECNGDGGDERHLDDDGAAHDGQYVPGDDSGVGQPRDLRGVHVQLAPHVGDDAAHQAEEVGCHQDAEHGHQDPDVGAEDDAGGQQDDHGGQRHDEIDGTVGDGVEPAAAPGGPPSVTCSGGRGCTAPVPFDSTARARVWDWDDLPELIAALGVDITAAA